MLHDGTAPGARPAVRRTALWGTQWGQMDSVVVPVVAFALGYRSAGCFGTPFSVQLCRGSALVWRGASRGLQDSYLVDSASSHMLVSKIKPCMSKYKQLYSETANGSLNQLSFI